MQELYNEHKDIVLELMDQYGGTIFSIREDSMRLITLWLYSDVISKRPFSKLIKDINEDLGMI